MGDGTLAQRPLEEVAAAVRGVINLFAPDVVVTFGPDVAFGHPDHVTSCLATMEAIRTMPDPPRLLHARFPTHEQLLLDLLVEWLTSTEQRFSGTAAFGHALKLFADGSSMPGFAADHFTVEWFPAGAFVIEQGEAANELFMSGIGVLILSQYVETRHAIDLLTGSVAGVGYLLKERIARPAELHEALHRIAAGGTAIDPDVVAAVIGASRTPDPLAALTARERDVLTSVAEGRSNEAIAERLAITHRTVETHLTNILIKLDLAIEPGTHRRVLAVLAYRRVAARSDH